MIEPKCWLRTPELIPLHLFTVAATLSPCELRGIWPHRGVPGRCGLVHELDLVAEFVRGERWGVPVAAEIARGKPEGHTRAPPYSAAVTVEVS